jgi:hypothetical protein
MRCPKPCLYKLTRILLRRWEQNEPEDLDPAIKDVSKPVWRFRVGWPDRLEITAITCRHSGYQAILLMLRECNAKSVIHEAVDVFIYRNVGSHRRPNMRTQVRPDDISQVDG